MNRGIGTAVQLNSPVVGTLFLVYLFAFWAGEFIILILMLALLFMNAELTLNKLNLTFYLRLFVLLIYMQS